jgi:hypothetical protein
MWEGRSRYEMTFPLLEHRTNTTWTLAKAVLGEENYPILFIDHYGKGEIITVTVPDEYGYIYDLPADLLSAIRGHFTDVVPYSLRGPGQASLIAYDNDTFALYKFVDGQLTRGRYQLAVKGNADSITNLNNPRMELKPSQSGRPRGRFGALDPETVFDIMMVSPGELNFYKINWSENRYGSKEEFQARSAPHDFVQDDD